MTDVGAQELLPSTIQVDSTDNRSTDRSYDDIMGEMGQVAKTINKVWASQEPIDDKDASSSLLQKRISELKQEAAPYVREDLAQLIAPLNHGEVTGSLTRLADQEEPQIIFEHILNYEHSRQLAANPDALSQASYDDLTTAYNHVQNAIFYAQEQTTEQISLDKEFIPSDEEARQRITEAQELLGVFEIKGIRGTRYASFLLEKALQLLNSDSEPSFYAAIGEFCNYVTDHTRFHTSNSLYSPTVTPAQFLEFFDSNDFDTLFDSISIVGLEDGPGQAYQLTKAELRDNLKALDLPAAFLYGITEIGFISRSEAPPIEIYKPGEDRPLILDRGGDCRKLYEDGKTNCVSGGAIRMFVWGNFESPSEIKYYRENMIDVLLHELGHNFLALAPTSYVQAWHKVIMEAVNSRGSIMSAYAGEYQHDTVRFIEESFSEIVRFIRDPWDVCSRDEESARLFIEQMKRLLPKERREDFAQKWENALDEVLDYKKILEQFPHDDQ